LHGNSVNNTAMNTVLLQPFNRISAGVGKCLNFGRTFVGNQKTIEKEIG
jgi:hypothetical protein